MNTKKVALALLVVFALISLLPKLSSAVGLRNGNWWRSQSPYGKVIFVSGLFDGLNTLVDYTINKIGKKDYAKTMSVIGMDSQLSSDIGKDTAGQIVAGLDSFYHDFRNRKIFVVDAFLVIIKEINGDSKAEINKLIVKYRHADK